MIDKAVILIFKLKKSQNISKNEKVQQAQKNTIRNWLPVTEIRGQTAKTREGKYLGFLRITPINISLKSDNEKKRIISAFHEVINGARDGFQIFSIGRPIDLDIYIRFIGDMVTNETNPIKKRLLREYVRYASGLVSEGEANERRFYWILYKSDESSVISAAHELSNNLRNAGLEASLCDGQEIMDLLFCFMNSERAASEKAGLPGIVLPPVYS